MSALHKNVPLNPSSQTIDNRNNNHNFPGDIQNVDKKQHLLKNLINNFESDDKDIKIKRKHVEKLPTMKKVDSKNSFEKAQPQ